VTVGRQPGRPKAVLPAVLTLLVASLAACGGPPPPSSSSSSSTPAPAPARPLNVVLVVVDTLRADHLGAYGYGRQTSPNLDSFAGGAILFEDARSQATCTFPSVNSLLTSRYPNAFLGQEDERMGIPPQIRSLPEILKARGYTTLALSGSPIVRQNPSRFNPHGGFERGFDFFGEGCIWKSADCLQEKVEQQLAGIAAPFFLYLHFMDPHGPYRPPEGHPRRFASPDFQGPDYILAGDPNPISQSIYGTGPKLAWRDADIAHLVDLYDDEIAYFDEQFPRLLASLERAGVLDQTVIALVSDHGEEFMEHGHVKHCRTPFDTLVKTPFLLRLPGGPAGLRVPGAVQNLDLVPTLLDYLGSGAGSGGAGSGGANSRDDGEAGARAIESGFEGVSLRPRIEAAAAGRAATAAGDALAFSAQGDWRSVFDGRYKLLYQLRSDEYQLFDLVEDPGETRDRLRQRPEEFRRLRRALVLWLRQTEGGVGSQEALERSAESERQLRALGYIQ
jgi:arylsulfatase A-like enzyme